MVIFLIILRLSIQEGIILALQDLSDELLTVNGWFVVRRGKIQSHWDIMNQCNQNLLKLTSYPNTYQKAYVIENFEFDEMYFEMEVYFKQFSQSYLRIKMDQKIIFQQTFSQSILQQNNICDGSDSQYTIYQKKFLLGINSRQLYWYQKYIYTNGYKLSNGSSMKLPYLQDKNCVQFCSKTNSYLGGVDMLVCQQDSTQQSNLFESYITSQEDLWKFSDSNPTIGQQLYLTSTNYLINNYLYPNVMYSKLFQSTTSCQKQCYQIEQNILDNYYLQVTFLFYIFGEWDDGSQVGLYITGHTIYSNNMVIIAKQNGKYFSSTGSGFYFTNITSMTGVNVKARRTLITFQGKFYSNTVQIGFSQQIYGTGTYGFGNIYIYQSYNDPNIELSGLYGIPYQCIPNYYAFHGTCIQECPPYSYQDQTNNNCTDLAYQQSIIFNPNWRADRSKNLKGTYILKEFFNNNFNNQTINQVFNLTPPTFGNYLNAQPFSFIGNKKILGGNNSWGYGSYGIFINLPIHNQIRIYFQLYLIDKWLNTDVFKYFVDSDLQDNFYQDNPNQQIQGLSTFDQQINVEKLITHTQQQLKIVFLCQIQQKNSLTASCGISDLFILYDEYVDVLCNQLTNYYSYFTNNCEQCIESDCYLYPDYLLIFNPKQLLGCLSLDYQFQNSCQYCIDPGYQDQNYDGICECANQFVQLAGQCTQCHYSCNTCSGLYSYDCQSCLPSRQLVGSTCQCVEGFMDVFAQLECKQINYSCDYSCKTCFSNKHNHCVTCPDNSFRTITQYNACLCDQQFMDVGLALCQLIICDPTCQTCNGVLSSNCLTCSTNFRFENGYCICDGLMQASNFIKLQSK